MSIGRIGGWQGWMSENAERRVSVIRPEWRSFNPSSEVQYRVRAFGTTETLSTTEETDFSEADARRTLSATGIFSVNSVVLSVSVVSRQVCSDQLRNPGSSRHGAEGWFQNRPHWRGRMPPLLVMALRKAPLHRSRQCLAFPEVEFGDEGEAVDADGSAAGFEGGFVAAGGAGEGDGFARWQWRGDEEPAGR
jgi:hypothetical protein